MGACTIALVKLPQRTTGLFFFSYVSSGVELGSSGLNRSSSLGHLHALLIPPHNSVFKLYLSLSKPSWWSSRFAEQSHKHT